MGPPVARCAAMRSLASATVLAFAAACEDCPDRSVVLDVEPTVISRGTQATLRVTFPQPVFVEAPPARERDISIELRAADGDAELTARWDGDGATADPVFARVSVVDETTLEVVLALPPTFAPGPYELSVIGDAAGACLGPNGTVTLAMQ